MAKQDQLEQLFRPAFKGPLTLPTSGNPAGGQFAGRTIIASGGTSVAVLTTAVHSDSIIRYGVQVGSMSTVASAVGHIVVNSIVDGTSFMFARHNAYPSKWDDTIMWEIVKT
jgi:hypothetical protein